MLRNILIYDRFMAGKPSTSYGINCPLNFRWANAEEQYGDPELANIVKKDIVVYTDHCIQYPNKIGQNKIAWLIEPEQYFPWSYAWIKENFHEFELIFTWHKDLLSIDKRFHFLNPGNSWIKREDASIYSKTKLCSMIASDKQFMSGHILRREIFNGFANSFDRYGKDTVPLDYVIEAYKDYMFTIVVENVNQDYMFTEKLITPMLCGTVPIYSGCPSLGNFFDMRGIITFDKIWQIPNILETLTIEKYKKMLPFIELNFRLAQRYQLLEDNLYEKLVELKVIK